MQVLELEKITPQSIEGVNAPLSVFVALKEANLTAQLVVVPPFTRAPKLGTALSEKMFILIVEGTATFTNGEYYEKLVPGRMVQLDAGEMRAYQTEKERLVALEVRYPSLAKPITPVQVAMPVPEHPVERKQAVTYEV